MTLSDFRVLRGVTLFGLTCAWLTAAAHADEGMEAEFAQWADRHDMHPTAMVALDPQGQTTLEAGSAKDINRPMAIASISKTIAGQCVMHMVEQDILSLETTTGEVLGWSGPPATISIAQLLTHSGGFGPDRTQRDFWGRNLTNPSRIEAIVEDVSTRALQSAEVGQHAYNNENYLVLEAVLAAVLTEDAVDWCLRSAPALAALDSLGRAEEAFALGFAGGLAVSAPDLAQFFHALAVADNWPKVEMEGRNAYGPGVIVQDTEGGQNLFHIGGLCLLFGPNFGAFGVQLANGNSVAVMYSGCAQGDALGELNALVLKYLAKS